jgi:hypothetical protein
MVEGTAPAPPTRAGRASLYPDANGIWHGLRSDGTDVALGAGRALATVTSDTARLALTGTGVGQLVRVTYGGNGSAIYIFNGPAGTESTASHWQLLSPITLIKPADTGRDNDTSMALDPHLQYPIAVGAKVEFEARLKGTMQTVNLNMSVSGSFTGTADLNYYEGQATFYSANDNARYTALPSLQPFNLGDPVNVGLSSSYDPYFILTGSFAVTGAGTFGIGWSQGSAEVGNTATLRKGSRIRLWIS